MNTLTRARQAGRNNLPVKVVRTPFLRKSDFAPEFQETHLPQPRHRKPAVRRPKVCCSAMAFTTATSKAAQ